MRTNKPVISTGPSVNEALRTMQDTVEAALVRNHRDFLQFLTRRVGDADAAEDVLQQFYVRAVGKGNGLRQSESVVAWLYKLLRTTLIDHYRRETTRRRHETDYAQMESMLNEGRDAALERAICACLEKLLPTLKAGYAEILQRVDLQGMPQGEVARELGLTPNNMRVRLHRARQAIKESLLLSCQTCPIHGFLDCDCQHSDLPAQTAAP